MERSRRSVVFGLVWPLLMAACGPRQTARQLVELHIASEGDDLAFTPDHLSCPSGANVRLFFHHTGEILHDPHDWVLLKRGTKNAFLAEAIKEPDETAVVDKSMVLAATPMCGKGQTVMIEFIAPAPGTYAFVCSVPGHGDTMQGILTVTA
jgi:azurin